MFRKCVNTGEEGGLHDGIHFAVVIPDQEKTS